MKHTIKKKERNLKTDTLLMTLESCGLTFFVRIIIFNNLSFIINCIYSSYINDRQFKHIGKRERENIEIYVYILI